MPTSADRPLKKRKRTSAAVAAAAVASPSPPASTHSDSDAEAEAESEAEDAAPQLSAMDLLRLHFESQFEPIETSTPTPTTVIDEGSDSDEWNGISGDSSSEADTDSDSSRLLPAVVVEHSVSEHTARAGAEMTRGERKRFMNGKVAAPIDPSAEPAKAPDETEVVNLKHDLALQRLLQESHLLDADTTTFEATGKNRLKAIDSRVQALGGKPMKGQKMSMSMRKGIDGKRASDEGKRRKEARENGIVLETEKKDERKRKRGPGSGGDGGIGGPSVGRFKGGVLTLSKSDVRSIEGPKERKGGKGGRGGKGGGRGRGRK